MLEKVKVDLVGRQLELRDLENDVNVLPTKASRADIGGPADVLGNQASKVTKVGDQVPGNPIFGTVLSAGRAPSSATELAGYTELAKSAM